MIGGSDLSRHFLLIQALEASQTGIWPSAENWNVAWKKSDKLSDSTCWFGLEVENHRVTNGYIWLVLVEGYEEDSMTMQPSR
jgi:hypothetical protein